jgi:hypothetical protein
MSEHYQFIAISPGPYTGSGYYGLGNTVEDAKAQCKAHGGKLTHYLVKQLPDHAVDIKVDGMSGQITWTWEEGHDGPFHTALPIVATRGLGLKVDA